MSRATKASLAAENEALRASLAAAEARISAAKSAYRALLTENEALRSKSRSNFDPRTGRSVVRTIATKSH